MSKNATWLDAFYSSSLQLKAECGVVFLALDDLAKDRSDRLLVLLVGYELSHLKILNGTDVHCEISLPEMAVAICTFSIAGSLPGIRVYLVYRKRKTYSFGFFKESLLVPGRLFTYTKTLSHTISIISLKEVLITRKR